MDAALLEDPAPTLGRRLLVRQVELDVHVAGEAEVDDAVQHEESGDLRRGRQKDDLVGRHEGGKEEQHHHHQVPVVHRVRGARVDDPPVAVLAPLDALANVRIASRLLDPSRVPAEGARRLLDQTALGAQALRLPVGQVLVVHRHIL